MINIEYIYTLILCFIISFVVAFISIPSIIKVVRYKNLYDEPENRSVHVLKVPTLGGLAIFAGFVISLTIFADSIKFPEMQFIITATIIMFFIGIKDDILIIAPITKLGGQIIASIIIIILADIRFTNLFGLFWIFDFNYFFSFSVTLLAFLIIINGFNFIDGIDGLAASIGILILTIFGIWFFLIDYFQLTILSISLIGALFAFLYYNLFSKKNKIFMGDTGSLVIGLVVSVLAIKFNEVNVVENGYYTIENSPAVLFGILIIPVYDLIRVSFFRYFLGKPIFKADKGHIHHQLLAIGFTQRKALKIIIFINLLFIIFVFSTSKILSTQRMLLIVFVLAVILTYILNICVRKR